MVDSWNDASECTKKEIPSRTGLWRVEFHDEMCNFKTWHIAGGHCNAVLARKTGARARFFAALAKLCVRGVEGEGSQGARLFLADMNMATYGVELEMQRRGFQFTLASFHCEIGHMSDRPLLFDSRVFGSWSERMPAN